MLSQVKTTINKYNMINSGDRVFAAVSGGADSVCLLLVLLELSKDMGFSLEAIHVEHGIRGAESEADASFTEELCKRLGVKCHIYRIDAPKYAGEMGVSLEEAARTLRYDCFHRHIEESENVRVAIAHNMDDNAETMLLNMTRGTGIFGLRGIRKVRGHYIRPLIECTRQEIEAYLQGKKQDYRTDSTNSETEYTRNNIRHNVMPVLKEINSGVVLHFFKLSELQEQAVNYIDKQSEAAYHKYSTENGLSKELLNEDLIIITSAIHKFLIEQSGQAKDIGTVHIEAVHNLLKGDAGREINLPYNMIAISEYDRIKILKTDALDDIKSEFNDICITSKIQAVGDSEEVNIDGTFIRLEIIAYNPSQEITSKTYTKMLDCDKIKNGLCVRHRKDGDYIVINKEGARKSLSRYMIDEKIPKRDRDSVLLVCDGDHVMYVVGHRISEHYKIDETTDRVIKIEVTKA